MANVIGMTQKGAIIGLWRRGWSHRRIAKTLGLNRRTVARYVGEWGEEPGYAQPEDPVPFTSSIHRLHHGVLSSLTSISPWWQPGYGRLKLLYIC